MRKKGVTESELFRKMNILITDEGKEQLEYEKEKTTLLADMEIDNSALVRAMIAYFYENEKQLKKLVPFLVKTKGHTLLEAFNSMIEKNANPQEIQEHLGISVKLVEKIDKKYDLFKEEENKPVRRGKKS